jgi:restriction system protein
MSIWTYPDVASIDFPNGVKGMRVSEGSPEGRRIVNLWHEKVCPYCANDLHRVVAEQYREVTPTPPPWPDHQEFLSASVYVCPVCGWWKAQYTKTSANPAEICTDMYQGGAVLKELDLTDLSVPIADVRDYLAARYEQRFTVNPRILRAVVVSVFSDLGYSEAVTEQSGDGIEAILKSGDEIVGVQVKCDKDKISTEQIRSFAGVLGHHGLTRGIFVSTSTFEDAANSMADEFNESGYRIELLDAQRFYDALSHAQRKRDRSWEEFESLDVLKKLPLIRHIVEH